MARPKAFFSLILQDSALVDFLKKRVFFLTVLFFVVFSVTLWLATNGQITSITSDIDLYNHYAVSLMPSISSDLSLSIESQSSRIDYFIDSGWTPTPFYSLFVLSPVWLFGSQKLLWLEGTALGIGLIFSAERLLRTYFREFSDWVISIIVLLFALNFNFLVDSIAVSTMSVAAFFVMFGLSSRSRLIRITFLSCAAATRSNFLIALLPLFVWLPLCRPSGWRRFLGDCFPAILVSLIFYKNYYSTYPGGGLNYLLFASYQGLDYAVPFSRYLIDKLYSIDIQALDFEMTLSDALKLFTSWESFAYVWNLSALKLSVTLGLVHEKLFQSDYGLYVFKIWRTIYFSVLSMPGFYSACALVVFARKSINSLELTLYLWVLLYLIGNSMLIGDPRYLIGSNLLLIVALVRLTMMLQLNNCQKNISS